MGNDQDVYSDDDPKVQARKTSEPLFYGGILSFIGGVVLVMGFASPYWLVSWDGTSSPFKNMGLWEFCFYRFRHPDYQFDHLFNGCHPIYGDEYRLIREKLLPGWLMVVQLFVSLSLISSFLGQLMIILLLLRYPLDIILRFEWHFSTFAMACNIATAVFLLIGVAIFGAECWNRDWLLYPNYNYVSWSYGFACFSILINCIAAVFLFFDSHLAKNRMEQNHALIMQMQPPPFSYGGSYGRGSSMGASGFI